eukprot:256951-Chlamydomonas_euryale.AAC.1
MQAVQKLTDRLEPSNERAGGLTWTSSRLASAAAGRRPRRPSSWRTGTWQMDRCQWHSPWQRARRTACEWNTGKQHRAWVGALLAHACCCAQRRVRASAQSCRLFGPDRGEGECSVSRLLCPIGLGGQVLFLPAYTVSKPRTGSLIVRAATGMFPCPCMDLSSAR